MGAEHQYLLIIACSQRKHQDAGLLPAIERYDGGNYRLLRKARRDGKLPESIDVLILSAKYGLITAFTPIVYYNQKMDQTRAFELKAQTIQFLQERVQQYFYKEVYIDLGTDYYAAIGNPKEIFINLSIVYGQGRIGERLAKLKNWLHSKCSANDTVFEHVRSQDTICI